MGYSETTVASWQENCAEKGIKANTSTPMRKKHTTGTLMNKPEKFRDHQTKWKSTCVDNKYKCSTSKLQNHLTRVVKTII